MQSGLDIVSLPSHTSHALQLLDVACFKPFKIAFRRCRDLWSLENNKKEVGKQDLCEWMSRALRAALTPNNIRAWFQSTRIWPLDRTAVRDKMHAAAGFEANCKASGPGQGGCEVTGPAGHLGVATGDGEQPASHYGRAIGLAGIGDKPPDKVDVGPASTSVESDSADEPPQTETNNERDETSAEVQVCSPADDRNTRRLHFYVDVPDAHESTYPTCDRSVGINPGFQTQLPKDDDHDIISFVVLPELIPARKRKR